MIPTPLTARENELLDMIAQDIAVIARYKGQRVEVDIDTANNGSVDVIGYFGQQWTHGGYAPVNRIRVKIADLTDKELV